jgi:hypothetical protein
VTVFQTGTTTLGPLAVTVDDTEFSTEPLSISVLSVLPADEQERTLKDIVPPHRAQIRTFTVILILLCIAAAFGAFVVLRRYLIRPRRAPKTIIETERLIDPYQYSLEQLQQIKQEHERERADMKQVYTTISHSLRLFFGNLLSIQALEMTTSEMKRLLKGSRTNYVRPNHLINILHRSDMVKFAKEKPARKKVDQDIDQSITIIQEAHQKATGPAQVERGDG